jgi:ligand-binding sensor domain-containing protein
MKFIQSYSYIITLCLCSYISYGQQLEYFSNPDGINDFLFEEDKMWVATEGGLLELDLEGNLIKKHTVLDGINAPHVEYLVQDEEGDLYMKTSSRRQSIQTYREGRWVNYNGFEINEPISLIHSNEVFGYLDNNNSNIYLKLDKKWQSYSTDLKGYELDEEVVMDDEENLWVACKGGVIRHDGQNVKKYTFLDEYETPATLLKDKNGILWALDSWEDWYVFDVKKDSWSACTSKECQQVSTRIFSFSDTENNLWFANEDQDSICKYDGKSWTWISIPVRDIPKSIDDEEGKDWVYVGGQDKQGNLWFGSRSGNLYKFDGRNWTSFDLSEKAPMIGGRSSANALTCIIEDKDKNIWMTGSDFVNYYDVEKDKSTFFRRDDFVGDFQFAYVCANSIIEGQNGDMYINPQEGVFQYSKVQKSWEYILEEQDMASMYAHPEGNKISFLSNDGQFITMDTKEGSTTYTSIVEPTNRNYIIYRAIKWDKEGGLWFSTNEKLYYYSQKDTLIVFDSENSPVDLSPRTIYEDTKGNIWVNIKNGIAYWNGEQWTTFTNETTLLEGINSRGRNKIGAITEDKNGNVLVRSSSFIFSWDGNQWKSWRQWNSCLDDSYSSSLFVDSKDNLWIFNAQKSIYKCKGTDCIPIITNYDAECVDVLEDKKGRIWIVTEFGGIFRYSEK